MINFRNLTEAAALLSVLVTGTTAITSNLIDAGVKGSNALNSLAADAEDAAVKSTELNKMDRAHQYTLRLSEIKQLETGIIDPDEFKDFKAA